jgi:hypothetical protein
MSSICVSVLLGEEQWDQVEAGPLSFSVELPDELVSDHGRYCAGGRVWERDVEYVRK